MGVELADAATSAVGERRRPFPGYLRKLGPALGGEFCQLGSPFAGRLK